MARTTPAPKATAVATTRVEAAWSRRDGRQAGSHARVGAQTRLRAPLRRSLRHGGEALVVVLGHLVALRPVRADAKVAQELPRLALNIVAHVPRLGLAEEREVPDHLRVLDPLLRLLLLGLHALDAVRAHVGQAVRDPVHVLLNGDEHVGVHRGRAGPRDREEVREAGDAEAEVGAHAVLPRLLQADAVTAAEVDLREPPGHPVEAGGEDDAVELEGRAVLELQAARRHLRERVARNADELHVLAVEGLVVPRVDAHALRADLLPRLRAEELRDRLVLHEGADLAAHEVRGGLVGLVLQDQVVVAAAHEVHAALLPPELVLLAPLLLRDLEGRLRGVLELNAEAGLERGGVPLLELLLLLR